MKKHFFSFAFILLFVGMASCTCNKPTIKGSWLKISEDGIPYRETQIKSYTDKNFSWQEIDNNIIIGSAAGEYKIVGDELYEFVHTAMYNNSILIGKTAKISFTIKGDTLTNSTVIPIPGREMKFKEQWVRIK